jgi:23S rRNA pseudouridine2605 synthase
MSERLQKILSAAGIASRRKSEELIASGRVRVNGDVSSLGDRADLGVDVVTVDGEAISRETMRYLALNKPAGYVCTLSDPQGRPTVMDLVDVPERVYPIGRLDFETTGLLLMTNDGLFAEQIAHPRYEIEKTYVVRLDTPFPGSSMNALRSGVTLEDGPTSRAKISIASTDRKTVKISIHEGRNRIVRRMFEAVGIRVTQLSRTRVGWLDLDDLPEGRWRELSRKEIEDLRKGGRRSQPGGRRPPRRSPDKTRRARDRST